MVAQTINLSADNIHFPPINLYPLCVSALFQNDNRIRTKERNAFGSVGRLSIGNPFPTWKWTKKSFLLYSLLTIECTSIYILNQRLNLLLLFLIINILTAYLHLFTSWIHINCLVCGRFHFQTAILFNGDWTMFYKLHSLSGNLIESVQPIHHSNKS